MSSREKDKNGIGNWFEDCSLCGQSFPIRDRSSYVYKLVVNGKVLYFCKYTHYLKAKELYGTKGRICQ